MPYPSASFRAAPGLFQWFASDWSGYFFNCVGQLNEFVDVATISGPDLTQGLVEGCYFQFRF